MELIANNDFNIPTEKQNDCYMSPRIFMWGTKMLKILMYEVLIEWKIQTKKVVKDI